MNKKKCDYFEEDFSQGGEKHDELCNCPICNNGIREEHQYACLALKSGDFRIDADEYTLLANYWENEDESYTHFPVLEPDETKTPILAYGVLMPAYISKVSNWTEEMAKWKNFFMCTVEDDKVWGSVYTDIEVFEENLVYNENIPCAMLLHTTLDLSEPREFGFGHTTFLRYKDATTKEDTDLLENILNRPFLLCIAEKEDKFDGNVENWKQQIDKRKLLQIARRLF